jgi:tetratricopeptide (TPR) repeat protein
MKKYALLVLLPIVLGACSTNMLTLSVMEPAPVSLPGGIKKVGIINRSNTNDKKFINKLDQILSMEGKNLDRNGARECIQGVQDELLYNKRFDEVKVLDHILLPGPGMGIMPAPISTEDAKNICAANEVDALFVLESYDTNTDVSTVSTPITIRTPAGDIPGVEYTATMHTVIKTGWRIYDPKTNGVVIDQYQYNDQFNHTAKGVTPAVAIASLIGRKDAVNQISLDAGHKYALRIVPYQIRVAREYYVKGTDNFKTARRMAQTGDWDKASELWNKETTNPDPKIAGRAYYNMAIINEINGNLDLAIDWAQQAYQKFGNNRALSYVNILKDRQYRNSILKQQQEAAEK